MKTRLTPVEYLGFTAMDRRFSTPMLPWILREIRRLDIRTKLSLLVEGAFLKAYNDNFEPVLVHIRFNIIRKCQVAGRPEEFFYILWSETDKLLHCYLFRAASAREVTELFSQMKETSPGAGSQCSSVSLHNVTRNVAFQKDGGSAEHLPWNTPADCHLSAVPETRPPLLRSASNASVLTSLSADLTPSDSHFFEVLYIGKVKVSQRKVPDSLIDDALRKFDQHEAEKARHELMRRNSLLSSKAETLSSDPGSTEDLEDIVRPALLSNLNLPQRNLLSSTSTTPLEPNKGFAWKSAENLHKEAPEIDKEFDDFTKHRAEKTNENFIRKSNNAALEPKVLVLSATSPKISSTNKVNLSTLEEDERESTPNKIDDLQSIISDTASSITQFCQESARKDLTPNRETKVNSDNPFNTDNVINSQVNKIDVQSEVYHRDPFGDEVFDAKAELTKTERQDSQNSTDEESKRKLLQRSKTGLEKMIPENKQFLRDRSASIGALNLHKTPIAHLIGEQNRTMLFQVGRSELRLISPDRKQILLLRSFRDIASCVLGRGNRDHFGFVCREQNTDGYVVYVFKCESDSIAIDVINAIKQAFNAHADLVAKSREKSPNMTCEHCPMLWYHRLCHDIEGMNDKKTHAFILRRMEQLPEDEQDQIIVKYQGGTNTKYEVSEHNAFLMMLLRAHCEAKQQRHVHDTAENRSEFLNQYLGGGTIFMKAKRSLSNGFDHLLKRKSSKDDLHQSNSVKKEPSPNLLSESSEHLSPDVRKSITPGISNNSISEQLEVAEPVTSKKLDSPQDESMPTPPAYGSPIMDIFLRTGDTKTTDVIDGSVKGQDDSATWRQQIFQRVVSPTVPEGNEEDLKPSNLLGLTSQQEQVSGTRTRAQLRELWKMAIDQTILLVRMEKENAKLKQREESSAVRRIKLEYQELGTATSGGAAGVWDTLLSHDSARLTMEKRDRHMLTQCVRQGVPRVLRGSVWYFLAEQACMRSAPPDAKRFPMYNVPYKTLLSGLTKHQHAILIDLGRTFPQHSYYASALGPGQLALYNLLKAYSLLDPEVGYCQGLSFIAAVLLLHMEEAEAFVLLRHLMFRRGLRKQYLPDMSALQVQMYQLARLLRDYEPELLAKLGELDIDPALYAAPWMLTLFTSQFPLGFVVRVFDLIFLDSPEVVFSFSLALLSAHRDGLMLCESCEEAAEYLRHKLPDVDDVIYERVMKKVFSLDINGKLHDYEIEYGVLREEMPRVAQLESLRESCRQLERDKQTVLVELDAAMDQISTYQSTQSRLEAQNRSQEQQLLVLSKYILSHSDKRQELPPEVKRICQINNKKVGFSSKIAFPKFSNDIFEEEEDKKVVKTGLSTPNLFAKLTKDELNKLKDKKPSPENDKKFILKKSISVNSGLIAPKTKQTLKAYEENKEPESLAFDYNKSDSLKSGDILIESINEVGKKNSGFFANSHELVRQERLFAQKQKQDFDENFRRLDQKLYPNKSYIDNLTLFQSHKSVSLNLDRKSDKGDSGIGTPITPTKVEEKQETSSVVSHPLSDCDVDITFDGDTQLKCVRPIRHVIIEAKNTA